MPKAALSPIISREQSREDEADRVAQGFTAEEQAQRVDLMTPVMSEAERKVKTNSTLTSDCVLIRSRLLCHHPAKVSLILSPLYSKIWRT